MAMLTANLWLVAVVLGVVAFTASLVLVNKRKKHRYQSPKIKMKLEKVTEDMLDTPSKEDGYDLDGIGSVRTQSFSRDTKSTVDTAQSDHENQPLNDTQVQRSQAADPLDDLSFSGEVPKERSPMTLFLGLLQISQHGE